MRETLSHPLRIVMKYVTLILLFSSFLFAYQKGDTLTPQMQKSLGMESGKIYIVDFFASWCHSCEKEIPLISRAKQKLDPTKVEIVGVDVDKNINKAKEFQAELKSENHLTFRVVNDPENIIIKAFKPIGMPALFYVKDGVVLNVIYGAVDNIDEIILQDVKRLEK